ncbi:uncharacterized protein DUF2155 [Stakelama pacifica]|uniref:Uncharacterized protein DUF2155 n=1 Tax=Stakelama pacifica TaxID=517720 RepID=A0A4R6FSH0_9SPHN|nr:uncharacterized protein DUF2155 [Stakelama pacifica]
MDAGRVNRKRLLLWGGGLIAAVLIGIGVWQGIEAYRRSHRPTAPQAAPETDELAVLDRGSGNSDIVTVQVDSLNDPNKGATPMKERVATLGILNKRNGQTRDIRLKPGQSARLGGLTVRLRACERTAPWEPEEYTGAFVQVDRLQADQKSWKRVFSGWLYKERPALNVVQDPVYDVWPKSCEMSFPEGGEPVSSGSPASRSSAKKSAPAQGSEPVPAETPSPTAAESNPT